MAEQPNEAQSVRRQPMERQVDAYFVSLSGSDGNPGSAEAPFRTLARAQQAVRERIRGGMSADLTVYIRGGRYELGAALRFDERDSGRNGCRVIYRSAPGEQAILCGGSAIAGWQRYSGAIWRARVPAGRTFHTLYADGVRISKARLPATGYYETDQARSLGRDGIAVRPGDVPQTADLSCAQVLVWPGEGEWNWFSETKAVAAYEPKTGAVRFEHPCTWDIGAGSRYYLQGSLDFLTSPGQFHLDESAGWLYYWPMQGKPASQTVLAPSVMRVLDLRGSGPGDPVAHIAFHDLTFACTDGYREYRMAHNNAERDEHRDGLIYLNDARHIEFAACEIRESGNCGLFLDRTARDIVIERNRIEHVGYIGICASGYAPGEGDFTDAASSYVNQGHIINHNHIACGGQLIGHGCGIMLYQSGGNEISHNRISRMPRYGISLKGLRHKAMPEKLYGIPITWDNHGDFLHSRHNRIAFNDISHVMEDSQDGGMIESWGAGPGNVIHGNRLHHSGIHFSFGFGIYLDDASDGFTVSCNVLDHLYQTGGGKLWMLIFSKGVGNRILNNLMVANPDAIAAIGTQEMADEENKDVLIERNIICDSGLLYYFVNWREDRLARADCNLYWRPGLPCLVGGELPLEASEQDVLGRQIYTLDQWRTLAGGRFDGQSVVADPRFEDEDHGNYRLRPDSPAYGLGWTDIEFDKIGPASG